LGSGEYGIPSRRRRALEAQSGSRLVRARIKCQKDLRKDQQFVVVLTKWALQARICPYPQMVNQLERIKSFARTASRRLGIIAWSARLTITIPPAFQLADNTLVCVALPNRQVCFTREKDMQLHLRLLEARERMAAVGEEAVSILDRIIQDFKRLQDLERSAAVTSIY